MWERLDYESRDSGILTYEVQCDEDNYAHERCLST